MSFDSMFAPMNAEQLEERLRSIAIAQDLIAMTLTDGDILLGGISKHWKWDGKIVSLSFNTAEGKRFGLSHFIDVPVDLIVDIVITPLDDASTPKMEHDDPVAQFLKEIVGEIDTRLSVQDYPNPLASIIYEHNMQVASLGGLAVGNYIEKALARDAIPPKGIHFNADFLLYVDWPFFSQQAAGSTSVSAGIPPLIQITKDVSQSLHAQVLQRLRDSLADRIRRKISPTLGEHSLQGSILMPEGAQTTSIEGEECHLLVIAEDQGSEERFPILLKVKRLKFPLEFLSYVKSVLTFHGELVPIPVTVLGRTYQKVLLARAIGYLHVEE